DASATFVACGPFAPCAASYCTFAPSASDLKPPPTIALWWTNRSFPPSSGVMNPYPLSSLNHFTVPVAMDENTSSATQERAEEAHRAHPVLAQMIGQPSRRSSNLVAGPLVAAQLVGLPRSVAEPFR